MGKIIFSVIILLIGVVTLTGCVTISNPVTVIPTNVFVPEIPGGPGLPTIEITYLPAYGSFEYLHGQVWHVRPSDYRVAVFIKVGSGWWTKPYWDSPLTIIKSDGSWVCDIVTGGIDEFATKIAAFLVPAGYNPPLRHGESSLPTDVQQKAVASVIVSRI